MRRAMPWEPLDFDGRRVVEIGCGPLGGFGPLAIFCGATEFESAEPEWDADLFEAPEVVDKYHFIFYADLVALYGPRMDFAEFRKRSARAHAISSAAASRNLSPTARRIS